MASVIEQSVLAVASVVLVSCQGGKQCQFVSRLTDWIVSSQFKLVVILTSMFAYERQDTQLSG